MCTSDTIIDTKEQTIIDTKSKRATYSLGLVHIRLETGPQLMRRAQLSSQLACAVLFLAQRRLAVAKPLLQLANLPG